MATKKITDQSFAADVINAGDAALDDLGLHGVAADRDDQQPRRRQVRRILAEAAHGLTPLLRAEGVEESGPSSGGYANTDVVERGQILRACRALDAAVATGARVAAGLTAYDLDPQQTAHHLVGQDVAPVAALLRGPTLRRSGRHRGLLRLDRRGS